MSERLEFTEYYDQYKHKVYSFVCYRVGGDGQLAEDLTSDIFLKAFERFESYDNQYAFSTWIFTIARNKIIDHYRKSGEATTDIEDIQEVLADDRTSEEDWINNLDRAPKLAQIYDALEKLPDLQKDCVILKYLDDKTNKEIAEIVDESESYVRQILSRGLKKLKPLLQTLAALLITLITF